MAMTKPIRVTYYQRKARKYNNFSLENYFDSLRLVLPGKIIPKIAVSTFESSGYLKRLYNTIEAIFRQGDVNHITGDIHYINIFLRKNKNLLTILDCGQLKVLKGIKFKIFHYLWFKLPVSKSAYITTISHATKQDLLNYVKFEPEKIIVVPVCISPNFTRHDKIFNAGKPRILQIGVAPNKNIERLINALEGINCTLVIVGNLPQELKMLAEQKKVELDIFDQPLSESGIIEQYRLADIITLISTLEGFGMPIVEGNVVGRVVITANNTSMPEVAGNAAHLADPFSVENMKSGFVKIITDSDYRDTLIERGFENSKRFSNARIAEHLTELYTTIAQNK